MLRIHVMQLLYNLSDPAMENALYEIESMHRFAGLRMSDNLPDETTILNFRHFLERHKFSQRLCGVNPPEAC
jgi:IS5 family transposase